jgi:hypothetical protein
MHLLCKAENHISQNHSTRDEHVDILKTVEVKWGIEIKISKMFETSNAWDTNSLLMINLFTD